MPIELTASEFRNVVKIARENPTIDAQDIMVLINGNYQPKNKIHSIIDNFTSIFTDKAPVLRPATFEILKKCCKIRSVNVEIVKSKARQMELVRIRQQYCLIATLFKYQLEAIGSEIRKDHSTVIHNRNNAVKFCKTEIVYRDEINAIIKRFPKHKIMLFDRLTDILS